MSVDEFMDFCMFVVAGTITFILIPTVIALIWFVIFGGIK